MSAAFLPLPGLKRALLIAAARLSHSVGDCLRFGLACRIGGFFFHASQDRFQPFGKRLGGGSA